MSIRNYLVWVLISILILLTFLAAIQGYRASMIKATKLFDSELEVLADALILVNPNQHMHVKQSLAFSFQLWQSQRLVLRSENTQENAISSFAEGFQNKNFDGQRWRVYAKKSDDGDLWLFVAQPLQKRFELAESVILAAVAPIVLSIPIIALLIYWVVSRGLMPLNRLTRVLEKKNIDDFSKINIETDVRELKPVIATLDNLFVRLGAAFKREQSFASDAAHELRTPLSILKINSYNLGLELGKDSESFENLQQGIDRMTHVVDQVLALHRTNSEQTVDQNKQINIQTLLRETISDLYADISQRRQDISLEGDYFSILGNEFALTSMAQNLINNASKYTPDGGSIVVSTCLDLEGCPIVTIEDSGPGISSEEHDRIFDRFYRIGGDRHDSNIVGCGLGLAIVKHIADLHQARIQLSTSKRLGGLSISILFKGSTQ